MPQALEGRIAIVTGAGSGMGAAMAGALLEAGASVVGVDINGAAVRSALGSSSRLYVHEADLSDREACERITPDALARFGRLDILINNAGVGMAAIDADYSVKPVKFWTVDIDRWERLMNINVRAPLILAKAAAAAMVEQSWGRIINVTTSLDTMIFPHLSAYGQSKASLEAASASWAKELDGTGVTVNVLVPGGPVDTAFLPSNTTFPRDKLIKPDAMGAPAVWLASPASDGFSNRRLIARQWDAEKADMAHAMAISSAAAWAGYGASAAIPSTR